ncbi:GNAT family N-acetyltransferase [Phormidium sp. CLA17]|uniref:GNAT family N-acetyltransferase n=1 Tax=Leptolyngbya sp. Cla-17 TaxID=2803751 RepID=UPI001492286A|nr:GNAT family N-acetyltransferase [Leptolyngbya sp. Cla-17]MBM0742854.1 GNAT family N-acetyltransferase [Leptolyngbya sp. Cla-17]
MHIRPYVVQDTAAITTLFHDTIHHINSRDYTPNQINAWAPPDLNIDFWVKRLSQSITYVAEQDYIVGFGNLESNGHLDCFYCHKDFQGMGVGSRLLATLEAVARSQGIQTLTTEASITARSFFEAKGFRLITPQTVERRGQSFLNFVMEKNLIDNKNDFEHSKVYQRPG